MNEDARDEPRCSDDAVFFAIHHSLHQYENNIAPGKALEEWKPLKTAEAALSQFYFVFSCSKMALFIFFTSAGPS